MSVSRADMVADIRRYIGDDGAESDDDYRFSPDDVTASMQLAVNRMFDEVPVYLYDTEIVLVPPTITGSTSAIPITGAGRVAMGHLCAYYLLVQDKEDANNLAVANSHYAMYQGERMKV